MALLSYRAEAVNFPAPLCVQRNVRNTSQFSWRYS